MKCKDCRFEIVSTEDIGLLKQLVYKIKFFFIKNYLKKHEVNLIEIKKLAEKFFLEKNEKMRVSPYGNKITIINEKGNWKRTIYLYICF